MGLSPGGGFHRKAALQWACCQGGGRGADGWLWAGSLVLALNPESCQMRLLLVKRGSALPLYLRLVTDHLRLFTLYEQVSWGCEPSLLIL